MKNKIIEYYKKAHIDYQLIYFRRNNYSMNYGYWDRSATNRHQALLNLNKVIASKLKLNSGHLVLDAGCGLGESSFWFAKNINCRVKAVSIAPNQIQIAKKIAKKRKLDSKVKFSVADYTKTKFSKNHFDAIIAIETICHLQDKTDFYKEAFRILKPGGKLAVAEYYQIPPKLSSRELLQLNKMLKGWVIPNLWTKSQHLQALKQIGFSSTDFLDYSINTIKTSRFLYLYSIFGIPIYWVLHKIGLINNIRLKDALSCKYQYLTKKQNLWGHSLIIATKPA